MERTTAPDEIISRCPARARRRRTREDLGPWLAGQWGRLAGVDPELLAQIDL